MLQEFVTCRRLLQPKVKKYLMLQAADYPFSHFNTNMEGRGILWAPYCHSSEIKVPNHRLAGQNAPSCVSPRCNKDFWGNMPCAALGLGAMAPAPDQMPTLAQALSRAVHEERGGGVSISYTGMASLDTGGPAS